MSPLLGVFALAATGSCPKGGWESGRARERAGGTERGRAPEASPASSAPLRPGLLLNFTASWGDLHYLGLTGLEVVGKGGWAIPVLAEQLSACPRDLNELPEHTDDSRTLDK